jgi:predicted DNA-binding transcriptional regulator YafY
MGGNSKLKILYILELMRKTDEHHPMNSTQIAERLQSQGITAERKSIGRDIQCLEDAGYDILKCENHNYGWYMTGQEFEDYELKILADAVATAKFLTVEDSREMIKKIKNLATKDGERIINATMVMDDTLKLMDKEFKYKFDAIMRAITEHKQIRFQYEDIVQGNKRRLRKDGKLYQVTPYYLGLWGPEYFIVANMLPYNNTIHFRVEMMTGLETVDEPARPMAEIDELKTIGKCGRTFGDYIRETVHLWSGATHTIQISGINHIRQDVIRKFGHNLMFMDCPNDRFSVYLSVAEGAGFYQWVAKFGPNIKIEGPQEAIEEYKTFVQAALAQYENK